MAEATDVDATDSAVALADEEGVDLSEVEGTGTGGKVTKADVEAHLEAQEVSDDDEEPSDGDGDEEEAIHTSDAAARVEGVKVGDVQPDPAVDTHASDGSDYAFPPGGDVDVSTVPTDAIEGETKPPIALDSWVKLGDGENVPEEVQGAWANIVSVNTDDEENPVYQVRTRDEHNSTLYLGDEDFAEVHPGGVGLRGVGP